MKRDLRIWMVIALILIVGIGSTSYTRQLVDRQETMDTEFEMPGNMEIRQLPEGRAAGEPPVSESEPAVLAAPAQASPAAEPVPETTLAIPPVGLAEGASDSAADETKHHYIKKLEALDAQIVQNRAGNKDQTTNTLKATADYELRVWETEVDLILDTLAGQLGSEEYERLLTEQRTWIREREQAAMEASGKHAGSALESVEYATSLAEQTRGRVYSLADQYPEQLETP